MLQRWKVGLLSFATIGGAEPVMVFQATMCSQMCCEQPFFYTTAAVALISCLLQLGL
jgi:hypothetical protein